MVGRAAMAASLRCLVLNASLEPISVVSAQRGLVLLLKERAMMLERAQVCVRAQWFVLCHAGGTIFVLAERWGKSGLRGDA